MILNFIWKSSIVLAALLICYYFLFSRDKRFIFNRFFLLSSILFSLLMPFIDFSTFLEKEEIDVTHLEFANTATVIAENFQRSNKVLDSIDSYNASILTESFFFLYVTGCFLLIIRFAKNLFNLKSHFRNSQKVKFGNIELFLIEEKISPYSFIKGIFINKEDYEKGNVDLDILRHERVHVTHLHSIDILFIEILLVFYWFSPLVWLYRRHLKANHEYCADDIVTKDIAEIESYCNKIVNCITIKDNSILTSGFNYTLIKNRILMMNRKKTSIFYFGNKLIIAALTVVFISAAFSLKEPGRYTPKPSNKFVVLIDAGHGGKDSGATHLELQEKVVVLEITKAISKQILDPSIELVFTRESDVSIGLKERTDLVQKTNADLFLSLHINHDVDHMKNGIEVYYSNLSSKNSMSKTFSEVFAKNLKTYSDKMASINTGNFFVLKEASCPALILNLGYISNENDLDYLVSEENKNELARQIGKSLREISRL